MLPTVICSACNLTRVSSKTQTAKAAVVAGVGCINNTFGIKGVQEHTFFFKSITDANKLRRQVSECFERAALPNTSQEVRPPSHAESERQKRLAKAGSERQKRMAKGNMCLVSGCLLQSC